MGKERDREMEGGEVRRVIKKEKKGKMEREKVESGGRGGSLNKDMDRETEKST